MTPTQRFADIENPFAVFTPEDMAAQDTVSLFVDVFTDFPKIEKPGHAFLHGPRGSGKSMMFRFLMPDCQVIRSNRPLYDLPFLAFYVPLKATEMHLAELERVENKHASGLLNEHFLTLYVAECSFKILAELDYGKANEEQVGLARKYLEDVVFDQLRFCGYERDLPNFENFSSITDCFKNMMIIFNDLYQEIRNYFKKLSFRANPLPYEGALCGYLDFLLPIFSALGDLPFTPSGPIYLLVDDGDYLTLTQTQALNSWVATRTSSKVSIKISTQHQYKSYRTFTGKTIDTPHDYSEVNISAIYTGSRVEKYKNRVNDIVTKRLRLKGIAKTPKEFFPEHKGQEDKIRELKKKEIEKHKMGLGRGYRGSDDAARYARPDYIASLAGLSKSSPSYHYAGFSQLVDISSGIVRTFLDVAADMYSETQARKGGKPILKIPPEIQDKVVRDKSRDFLFNEFDKRFKDESNEADTQERLRKLRNLIDAFGGLFRQALLDKTRSERRVFSMAFSDQPSPEVESILEMGVQFGYFHKSTIGKKDSKSGGRTRLYILSRFLTPQYKLDPTGFAGYLFMQSSIVEEALENPDALLRRLSKSGFGDEIQTLQLELF